MPSTFVVFYGPHLRNSNLAGVLGCKPGGPHSSCCRWLTIHLCGLRYNVSADTISSSLIRESINHTGKDQLTDLKTRDGVMHYADVLVVAGKTSIEFPLNVINRTSQFSFHAHACFGLPPRALRRKSGNIQN